MKIIVRILTVLLGLILIFLIVAAFSKKEYSVIRSIEIKEKPSAIFEFVKLLHNQTNYNVWAMADSKMKREYSGVDGTVGFTYKWNSTIDDVGQGIQTLTLVQPNKIESKIHFLRPFQGDANTQMILESLSAEKTLVHWSFHSQMSYPMNGVLLFADMDKLLGGQMKESLGNLKKKMEE